MRSRATGCSPPARRRHVAGRVVVGVDGSAHARQALRFACRGGPARRSGRRRRLVGRPAARRDGCRDDPRVRPPAHGAGRLGARGARRRARGRCRRRGRRRGRATRRPGRRGRGARRSGGRGGLLVVGSRGRGGVTGRSSGPCPRLSPPCALPRRGRARRGPDRAVADRRRRRRLAGGERGANGRTPRRGCATSASTRSAPTTSRGGSPRACRAPLRSQSSAPRSPWTPRKRWRPPRRRRPRASA